MKIALFTYPDWLKGEFIFINELFHAGLKLLHLRKPQVTEERMVEAVLSIDKAFRNRVMLHSHLHLVEEFGLKGMHFTTEGRKTFDNYSAFNGVKSTSFHTIKEVEELSSKFDYSFISPVFPSISKVGYSGGLQFSDLKHLNERPGKTGDLFALGGVEADSLAQLRQLGFDGCGVLGTIWKPFMNGNWSLKTWNQLMASANE